jgi:serine/threonine protein kinase
LLHRYNLNNLFRDVKPENFLIGPSRDVETIYIIDYGLAKAYRYHRTGKHLVYRDDKGVTGTIRFTSVNVHKGIESSRRDDLEAVMYSLIYLYYGYLPWETTEDQKFKSREELSEYIRAKKEAHAPFEL